MTDSELILNFLNREYKNDHIIIYLYVCGNKRSIQYSKDQIFKSLNGILFPAISETCVKNTIEIFLNEKKQLFNKGEFKFNPFY
jgi:hypothetical protein